MNASTSLFCPMCHCRPCICNTEGPITIRRTVPIMKTDTSFIPGKPLIEGQSCSKCGTTLVGTGPPINEVYCPKCPMEKSLVVDADPQQPAEPSDGEQSFGTVEGSGTSDASGVPQSQVASESAVEPEYDAVDVGEGYRRLGADETILPTDEYHGSDHPGYWEPEFESKYCGRTVGEVRSYCPGITWTYRRRIGEAPESNLPPTPPSSNPSLESNSVQQEVIGKPVSDVSHEVGWQPIATAPKDGTEMLGFREDGGIMLMRWTSLSEFLTDGEIEAAGYDEDILFQPDWFYADFVSGGRLDGDIAPTHWMPLPEAPNE